MTHPDTHRLSSLAKKLRRDADLIDTLGREHEDAQSQAAKHLSMLGFPRRGGAVKVSGGGGGLTAVEMDAEIAWEITKLREDVRDQVMSAIDEYSDYRPQLQALGLVLRTYRKKGMTHEERERMKLEQTKPAVCADHQHGKHGVDEWGDALCFLPSVKAGLCQQHYDAWRWRRRRDGISTDGDYAPVA